jgi:chemosensory pili system protein ChpA (sensor histidine kinase/response regulator)
MDDRDVAGLYIAEMHALLPVAQRHLNTLGGPSGVEQRALAAGELARLATAMADLSAGFRAADCAQVAHALSRAFDDPGAADPPPALLAAVTDALTYLNGRVRQMGRHQQVLAASETERAAAARLRGLLLTPDAPPVAYIHPTTAAFSTDAPQEAIAESDQPEPPALLVPAGGSAVAGEPRAAAPATKHEAPPADAEPGEPELTADERALISAFGRTPLRQRAAETTERGTGEMSGASYQPSASAAAPESSAPVRAPTAAELDEIPPEMKRVFVVETAEDLKELRQWLLQYEDHPEDGTALAAMGHIAHKIKGTAATLGFDVLAAVTLVFEDVLKARRQAHAGASGLATSTLLHLAELLRLALDAAAAERPADPALVERASAYRDVLLAEAAAPTRPMPAIRHAASPPTPFGSLPLPPPLTPAEADTSPRHPRVAPEADAILRVDVRRLDALVGRVSALALSRATLAQTRGELTRLRAELEQSITRLTDLSHSIADLHPLAAGARVATSGAAWPESGSPSPPAPSLAGRLFGRMPGQGVLTNGTAGTPRDALRLERISELDSAIRALGEVVDDISTTSRAMSGALGRLDRAGDDQASVAQAMQHELMQLRLVPLDTLVPRLQLEVRRLAPDEGKQITFTVRGELTEIDRNISEALAEPLLQLVRNAILHGIESPQERLEAGKPEAGAIWMHAYYAGNEVTIEIGDDGRGVNPHALAAAAVRQRLYTAEEAHALSVMAALDLMFQPGITTVDIADVQRGRGIGLDAVRTAITHMKGAIHVRSEVGRGSVFRIRVPISLSVAHALHVYAGGQEYAVPFSAVRQTLSLASTELLASVEHVDGARERTTLRTRVEVPGGLALGGERSAYEEIPVLPLAELLGFEQELRDPQLALLVETGRKRAAVLVDAVSEDSEVVVRALPPHLRRHAVRGATVTPDGRLLLLLDLAELVAAEFEGRRPTHPPRLRTLPHPAAPLAPHVLVVDDSVSIRRSLDLALGHAGFDVELAADGIEALGKMLERPPRVLVLDIEMPRLDGFELLSVLRGSPQFAGTRVVMLTSRAGEQHREHARQLGAAAYLIKPCPSETLIETVRALIMEPASIP